MIMPVAIQPADRLTTPSDTIRDRSDQKARSIVDDVVARVAAGMLKPGDRLSDERSLCHRYSAGRHTVRKAMETLERQGLIGRFPGRGSFVLDRGIAPAARLLDTAPGPTPVWPLFELTEARLLLEPSVAALAVERATPDDLQQLADCLDAIAATSTWRDFKEAKYAFHRTIVGIARNNFICHVFDQLLQSRRQAWQGYDPRYQDLPAARAICLEESRAILDALSAGRGEAAAEAVRRSVTRILISISGC
jgi:GntR family transcriptional repressor for pyruvate dehydrogenase complex